MNHDELFTTLKMIDPLVTRKGNGMKGMLVNVYRDASIGGDCTNDGITSKIDRAILVGDGIPEVFATRDGLPALRLVKRTFGKNPYFHAEPVDDPRAADGKHVGPMAGGNFVYSCDSRFRSICKYPIPVHDRYEDHELYKSNCD